MTKQPILLTFLIVVIIKILITSFWTPNYYDANEDYITHSLAHGINMDIWLREGQPRSVDFLRYLHPGFPFQISGWLLYISLNWSHTPVESVIITLQNPNLFWKFNQYYAFLLNIGFIFLSIRLFKIKKLIDFLIFFSLFFIFETTYTFAFFHLGNETFAIPIFALIAFFVQKSFASQRFFYFFMAGAFIGLSYLNKLNYIGWPFAIFFTLGIYAFNPGRLIVPKVRLYQSMILGFGMGIFVLAMSMIMLGRSGTKDMFTSHLAVFTNSGMYGQGSAGILNITSYLNHILSFFKNQIFFVIISFPIITLQLFHLLKDYLKSRKIDYSSLFLVSSFFLIFFIVMKQYAHHYFVPAAIVIPFLFLNQREVISNNIKMVILLSAVILASYNLSNILLQKSNIYHQDNGTGNEYIASYNKELEEVRSLPLIKNERRMWYYRIKSFEYCSRMVINWSSVFWLHKEYDKILPNDMIDLEITSDNHPYYLIFQKNYDNLKDNEKRFYKLVFDGKHLRVYRRI
jgi:hypothetical protein